MDIKEVVFGIVRHLMTFGGGFAVSEGWASGEDVTTITAGVITLLGVAWSAFAKKEK